MGQLFIPGEKEFVGPWFIGVTELEELDGIFSLIDKKIHESALKEIENKRNTESQCQTSISKAEEDILKNEVRKVILISKDGTRLFDKSIKGILKDAKLKDFKPVKFIFYTESGFTNKFSFSIERPNSGGLLYSVDCHDQDCKEEIIYTIDSWIEKKKPNRAKRFWSNASGLLGVAGFIIAIFSSLLIVSKDLPDFKAQYKDEICKIIKDGVSKDNEERSIELLLKYSIDYIPENVKPVKQVNIVPIYIFTGAVLLLLLSIFCPNTIIGLGKNKSLLNFYRIYTTLILYTLPVILIVPIIVDWIKTLIGL